MTTSPLPSGQVTMLFSDLEGSTGLLLRLGDQYVQVVDGQRSVQRAAWETHGGVEMGTEGDSFFVVFADAQQAVAAAAQAQRALAIHPWPDGERVRVRMGLHTGTPTQHGDGYVGIDLHRAARIAGTAHGGQVVLSEATRALVGTPPGCRLLGLGRHQLKDLAQPEHLFQLSIEGLDEDFGPLRSLGATTRLPATTTPLVGRTDELQQVASLVADPAARLVTLTGPGGSGKTRLAIAAARTAATGFPDGVHFVPLAAVTTAAVMWTSIAEVLDLPAEGRVPPAFFDHVVASSALFVLDNLEQVTGADDVVAELLAAAPQVAVLATSRAPLHVPGEHEVGVAPLEVPRTAVLADAHASGAVQMFVQHAQMVKTAFELTAANVGSVVEICRRLDGLPLALELAAARVRLLSPQALAARLDKALDFQSTGGHRPSRQQTLRQAIGWSYELLEPEQQIFLARLSVFAGGADLPALDAVAGSGLGADSFDLVAALADASLIRVVDGLDGEPRVHVLETVRSYAHEHLTGSGGLDAARDRHTQHFLELAQDLQLRPGLQPDAAARSRLETEQDNLRAALGWTLFATPDHDDRRRIGVSIAAAVAPYWYRCGYLAEGRRWLEAAVACSTSRDDPATAVCLTALAVTAGYQDDTEVHERWAVQALDAARRTGDPALMAYAMNTWGRAQDLLGNPEVALDLYREAADLARSSGIPYLLAGTLNDVAVAVRRIGRNQESLPLLQESLAVSRAIGDSWLAALAQGNMACSLGALGRYEEACTLMWGQSQQVMTMQDPYLTIGFAEDFAVILGQLGGATAAAELIGAAEAMRERTGIPRESPQAAEIDGRLQEVRAAIGDQEWEQAYARGAAATVEDVLTSLSTASSEPG